MRNHRLFLILIVGTLSAVILAQSRSLMVERRGDHLRVIATQMHFIEGKALAKLHDGTTITYNISLSAIAEHGATPAFLLQERFAVSFDLWEEKFSVVQMGAANRSTSRLTSAMAEAWCLENMPIPVRSVPEKQSFVIKLTCSVIENEPETVRKSEPGVTLAALLDVLGRKQKEEPLRWEASSGPLRLVDLKNGK